MRIRSVFASLLLAAFLVPQASFGQPVGNTGNEGIIVSFIPGCNFQTGMITAACIPRFIAHIVQFIFMLIGIFFLLNIMFAGYQIIIASIQGGERSTGYNRLIYSIIGFIVAAGSFIIMDIILTVVLG